MNKDNLFSWNDFDFTGSKIGMSDCSGTLDRSSYFQKSFRFSLD